MPRQGIVHFLLMMFEMRLISNVNALAAYNACQDVLALLIGWRWFLTRRL